MYWLVEIMSDYEPKLNSQRIKQDGLVKWTKSVHNI